MSRSLVRNTTVSSSQEQSVEATARLLRESSVASYPTETFYALGANPFDRLAVAELFRIKPRTAKAGITLIADTLDTALGLIQQPAVELENPIRNVAQRFWPGPLTLVADAKTDVLHRLADGIAAEDGSIAVRVSPNSFATALAAASGGLITATSANPSGKPAVRSAAEVQGYFPGLAVARSDDGGDAGQGSDHELPSTLLDVRALPFRILREGAISAEEILGAGEW